MNKQISNDGSIAKGEGDLLATIWSGSFASSEIERWFLLSFFSPIDVKINIDPQISTKITAKIFET